MTQVGDKRLLFLASKTFGFVTWIFSDELNKHFDELSPEEDERIMSTLEKVLHPIIRMIVFHLQGPELSDGKTIEQLIDTIKDFAARTLARHNQ